MFGVKIEEQERCINTDINVSRVGNVLYHPFEDLLDGGLVSALESRSRCASVS